MKIANFWGGVLRYWAEILAVLLLAFIVISLWNQFSLSSKVAVVLNGPPTPEPKPTTTPLPPEGTSYLKLSVDGISQLDSFSSEAFSSNAVPARMIIVVKEATTSPAGDTTTQYKLEQLCIEVDAFLDEDNVRLAGYDAKKAKFVLTVFGTENLAQYGKALPSKEQMYLVPDPTCTQGSD